MNSEKQVTPTGLMHLLVVYFVWGSTYLAIRVAVMPGSGFPPFMLGLIRVVLAGLVLLAWAWLSKQRIRPTKKELVVLAVSGLLMWPGANGLVMWAEQRADFGLAALLVGSLPIWVAILEAVIDRQRPSGLLIGSLLIGFLGIGLLSAPSLAGGVRADVLTVIALLTAPLLWGIGTILQTRNPVSLKPRASSAYQMLFGSLGFALLTLLLHEPLPTPTPQAWLAFAYLGVVGSLLAYTSFITGLQTMPTNIMMTYAYVNPVIALYLGWLVLDEKITTWTIFGTALVLLGVAGVFRERNLKRTG